MKPNIKNQTNRIIMLFIVIGTIILFGLIIFIRVISRPYILSKDENIAYSLADRGLFTQAKTLLCRLIKTTPKNASVYGALGYLFIRNNQYTEASQMFTKAFKYATSSYEKHIYQVDLQFSRAAEKLLHSSAIETTDYFNVIYDPSIDNRLKDEIIQHLEKAYQIISEKLHHKPKKFDIKLLKVNPHKKHITGDPLSITAKIFPWSSTLYIDICYIENTKKYNYSWDELGRFARHQVTYLFIKDITQRELPFWFGRGIAEYFGNLDPAIQKRFNNWKIFSDDFISFAELEKRFDEYLVSEDKVLQRLPYSLSYLGINYFISIYGIKKIKDILVKVSEGENFFDAFIKVTGKTIGSFETKWKKYFFEKYVKK